jgi:hypothetical protein
MIDDDVDTESIGKLLLGVWEQGTIYVFPNEGSVDAHYEVMCIMFLDLIVY